MPRQFKDFSEDVSQGTDDIKRGLDAVRDAADRADVASGKLSDTQKSGAGVADSYAKTMAGVSRELSGVAGIGQQVATGLTAADASVRTLGSSLSGVRTDASDAAEGMKEIVHAGTEVDQTLESISGRKVGVEFDASSAKEAKKHTMTLEERLDSVHEGETEISVDSSQAAQATKDVAGLQQQLEDIQDNVDTADFDRVLDEFGDSVRNVQAELSKMEAQTGRINRQRYLDLTVSLAGMQEFMDFADELSNAEKAQLSQAAASNTLDEALEQLVSENELLAAKLAKASNEAESAAKATRAYSGEVENARNVTDLLNNKMAEGEQEANSFAGGIGATNGVLIGSGVAAFFLAQKVAGLIDEFKDARIELAKFNVELAALEARAQGLGFAGTFDSLRDELDLTRAQSQEFFNVLREGAQSGVVSTEQLTAAAMQLRDTFGGDPTDRLREYVELLQTIPTIKTDLSITASLDDKAAAVFALAREGKVEAVIDLQAAGLLGGIEAEVLAPEDVELINAAQRTEKTIEDVQDFLTGTLFPSWGPQFSAIADGTSKVVAGVAGTVAALGALNVLAGQQLTAQHMTTAAVLKSEAADEVGDAVTKSLKGSGLIGGLTGGLKSLVGAGGIGGGGTAAGGIGAAAGAVATPAAIVAVVAAIAAGLGYAGHKLTEFGDDLIDEGDKVEGGLAKIEGAATKAAASLIAFGPLTGSVVAAVVAAEDYGEGLEALGQGLQEQTQGVQKYNDNIVAAGVVIEDFGSAIDTAAEDIKTGVKSFVQDIPGITKQLAEMSPVLGPVVDAFRRLPEVIYSDEYRQLLEEASEDVQSVNANMRALATASERYDRVLAKQQKTTQVSALALQRQFKATAAAVESGKIEFLDFRNEVAALRLENLSQIGGTAAEFDDAIQQAGRGVRRRFEELSESLVKRRTDILKDADLTASDRRSALLDLRKQELEATRTFVDGVEQVVSALFETPQIVQAGLEQQIAAGKFEIRVEEGIGGFDALMGDLENRMEAFNREFSGTLQGWSRGQAGLKQVQEALTDTQRKSIEQIRESIDTLPAAAAEAFGGIEFDEGGKIKNLDEARKVLNRFREESTKTIDEIDNLTSEFPEKSFTRLAAELKSASSRAKIAQSAIEDAAKNVRDLREAIGDDATAEEAKELAKAEKDLETLQTDRAKAAQQQKQALDALKSEFAEQLKGEMDAETSQKVINEIAKRIADGSAVTAEQLIGMGDNSKEMQQALQILRQSTTESRQAIEEELIELLEQADAQVKAQGALEAAVGAQDMTTALEQQRANNLEKIKEIIEKSTQIAEALVMATEASAKVQQRELEALQGQQSLALLTGDASEEFLDTREKQNEISRKTVAATQEAIKTAEQQRDLLLEQAAAVEDPTRRLGLERAAANYRAAISRLRQVQGEAVEALGQTGDAITGALERFSESLQGRRLTQQLDLSDAIAELASFSGDFAGAVEQSTAIAIAAAQEQADERRRVLTESLAQEERDLQAAAAVARRERGSAAATRVMQEGKILIEAKKRTEEAKIELQQKQKVVDAAQREASLKLEAIGVEEELIDAEMDFLSDIGGSFSSILKLQQAGVALEREKLTVVQEELETARAQGVEGIELRKREVAVEKQRFAFLQKQFGVQKDVFEKLLGKAFGEMRAGVGAARRRGSDVGLLGRERTRVMGRAGLFLRPGEGDVKTLAQRAADRAIAASFGKLGGGLPGRGLAGKAPERISIEKEIANAGKSTAESVAALEEAGTKRGSLFTHDTTLVKAIGELASLMGFQLDATEGVEDAVNDTGRKTEAGVAANEKTAARQAEQVETVREQLAIARRSFREQVSMARSLMTGEGSSQEAADAMQAAKGELERIQDLEKVIRRSEIMNPIAGAAATPEMQRILSGKPSPEEQAFQDLQLAMSREQVETGKKGLIRTEQNLKKVAHEQERMRETSKENVKRIDKETPAEVQAAKAAEANKSAVAEVTDRMSAKTQERSERASLEDTAKGGVATSAPQRPDTRIGGDSQLSAVRLMGQINITMNTKLFRAEMSNLVAEVINTEQVRSALDKRYLTPSK